MAEKAQSGGAAAATGAEAVSDFRIVGPGRVRMWLIRTKLAQRRRLLLDRSLDKPLGWECQLSQVQLHASIVIALSVQSKRAAQGTVVTPKDATLESEFLIHEKQNTRPLSAGTGP